ncbi:LuxR C-terminal-related transcriptional regulator [Umezawaea sp. Da 62-37]|uniref:LuxR C-terminal-related transcriptional regulator n=1 Tax=Umezawaea sp. Da 62-37 TaxID=3075927 RepID=UPI0028F721E7|nr:AAA family ATPase [Umezawaea sp. Da 62-37]WNV86896.1 AAA family ATPase [Umezawaea sp. Da 62-37]
MHAAGREVETAAVLGLTSGVLVVTGDPGTGKSTLLDLAAETAESAETAGAADTAAGRRVLRVTGSRGESTLPFSGLHQLIRPVLGEVDGLPERQRAALLGAIGLGDAVAPDRLIIGVAALALLSELSGRVPVLVVVDDVRWVDECSRDVLAFVARRIGDEPLALLVGARDDTEFPGFPQVALEALDPRAAAALLDAQPSVPSGALRLRVLAQAAGNPLALVELARAGCADDDILPLTERLERVYTADLDRLPAVTREALLLVAADTADLVAGTRSVELAPAEEAGLIRFTGGRARFRHPLVRSAIYHSAPLAAREQAHRTLADLLTAEPDRRAWHLAAAATGPDETVAAALEATASRAQCRGGHAAAAGALERAAELSPAPDDRARRLVLAAGVAVFTGQAHWVEQLATRAGEVTDDPFLLASAALRVGQVLTLTSRHAKALDLLLRAADEPLLAVQALASAAVSSFYSGDEHDRALVRDRADGDPWTAALLDPHENRAELAARIPELVELAGDDPGTLTSIGAMAWLLDETAVAVRIFDDALHRWRAAGRLPTGLGCSAGWAYLDHGLWAQARLAASSAVTLSADANLPHLTAATMVLEATAVVLSGETAAARDLAERALATIDPRTSRAVGSRARWALGMAAVADGDHVTAYEQFRLLFTADGEPVHYHFSFVAVAELVAAAVRTGHEVEAAEILHRAEKRLAGNTSARTHALLHRGRALLEPDDAEAHFQEALGDPLGEQWPFERAQVLLDYGEWLRRRRRITEARPKLTVANEVFRRLGARPWLDRAQGELRAAGIDSEPAAPDALTGLTPQQQQIIRLAARGLTNREIGERLFLSPRTVGSHLYRSFPKLGITARSQLRDIVDGSVTWSAGPATP